MYFSGEPFHIVRLPATHVQNRKSRAVQTFIDNTITLLPIRAIVRSVIEFNHEERFHLIAGAQDEVDMLLIGLIARFNGVRVVAANGY